MAKPITDAQKTAFNEFVEEQVSGAEEDGDEAAYVTIESFPAGFAGEEWEFHAANYSPSDSHDYYELFEMSGFEFEEESYGSWYVSRKTTD